MGIRTHEYVQISGGTGRVRLEYDDGTGQFAIKVNDTTVFDASSDVLGFSRETLAATGSGASTAAVLSKQVTAVTAADGTKAVALPAAATTVGPMLVINTVTTSLLPVYPVSGGNDNINSGAEDAAFNLGPGRAAWFIPVSATLWYVEELAAALPTVAELAYLDITTAGAAQASKALVLDASKELEWAVTDAGTSTVTPIDFTLTATGVGAEVDGAKFTTATEVALGDYANGMNAKLDFGAAGSVTGLGGAMCAELDLGPGTTSGSYAVFEGEMNAPASASLGTRTSFFSLNAWGANVAAIDTGGNLLDINGITPDTSKLFDDDGGDVAATDIVAGFRFLVNGTAYRLLACTEAAFYAS